MKILVTLSREADPRDNDYVRALEQAGLDASEILVVKPGHTPPDSFDGLVLGGGGDVDPSRFGGEARRDGTLELDLERDATDFACFETARAASAPVLGICRGMQVVNVALGGTLVQHLPAERPSGLDHQPPGGPRHKARADHAVRWLPGTRLAAAGGEGERAVNSRHHQGVEDPAPSLEISAVAPDGLVEGLEARGEPWLVAVQWHPENLAVAGDPASRRLFEQFVQTARDGRTAGSGRG